MVRTENLLHITKFVKAWMVGWGGGRGIVVVLVVGCDILTKSCPNFSLVLLLEYFLNLYLYIDIYYVYFYSG